MTVAESSRSSRRPPCRTISRSCSGRRLDWTFATPRRSIAATLCSLPPGRSSATPWRLASLRPAYRSRRCARTAHGTCRCTASSGRPCRRPYGASKPWRHRPQRRDERRGSAVAGATRVHRQRCHLGGARPCARAGRPRRGRGPHRARRLRRAGRPAALYHGPRRRRPAGPGRWGRRHRSVWRPGLFHGRPRGTAAGGARAGEGGRARPGERLDAITVPTLIIAGALDYKFRHIAQEVAQALPHAHLEIVPAAGHAVHLERPDLFDRLVADFLGAYLREPAHATNVM